MKARMLRNGELIIKYKVTAKPVMTNEQAEARDFEHCLVYVKDDKKGKVIHSFVGRVNAGVSSHPIVDVYPKIPPQFGEYIIFQSLDSDLQEGISTAAKQSGELTTPYSEPSARKGYATAEVERRRRAITFDPDASPIEKAITALRIQKTDKDSQREAFIELFAAFRAYMRVRSEHPMPLSKKKGLSCNQFVANVAKISAINKLFPGGLPQEILNIYNSIISEINRRKKANEGHKLIDVSNELFESFYKAVIKHLDENERLRVTVGQTNIQNIIEMLCRPLKGTGTNALLPMIMKGMQLDLAGCMIYVKDGTHINPMVLDRENMEKIFNFYQKVFQQIPPGVFEAHELENIFNKIKNYSPQMILDLSAEKINELRLALKINTPTVIQDQSPSPSRDKSMMVDEGKDESMMKDEVYEEDEAPILPKADKVAKFIQFWDHSAQINEKEDPQKNNTPVDKSDKTIK